jgi:thiamine biosynthesis protein ThiS
MEKNMALGLNGMEYFFNSKFTILELIDYLGFNKNVIVIDYNGILLDKGDWKRTFLRNGDSLEIFSIAGGG